MNDYSSIKVCLFDFDGTLVDTMGSFADLAASIIEREYAVPFDKARQLYLDSSGIPFFQQLALIFPDQKDNDKLAQEFEQRKQESFFSESFSDDVAQSLKTLRDNGFKVGVSSNNFQELVEQFIQKENVLFDYILGFKHGFAKGKEHFDFVQADAKCDSHNLLFVGDSIKDGEKAFDNNLRFIAKLGTFQRDDFLAKYPDIDTVHKLQELVEILL